MVLVTGGLFFNLPLPLAVVGHEGGTVLVVLNGLRLLSDPIRRATAGSAAGQLSTVVQSSAPAKPATDHEIPEHAG